MTTAFVTAAALPTRSASRSASSTCASSGPRMSAASDVVDKYFPVYRRNRAPLIQVTGEEGVKVTMTFVEAFQDVDKDAPPLLDYSDDSEFQASKSTSPSAISWPSGDGRSKEFKGVPSAFTQPNLKTYGPFPDFYKRSCDS